MSLWDKTGRRIQEDTHRSAFGVAEIERVTVHVPSALRTRQFSVAHETVVTRNTFAELVPALMGDKSARTLFLSNEGGIGSLGIFREAVLQ